MSDFMEPEIIHGRYYQVDTTEGIFYVPGHLCGVSPSASDIHQFVDSTSDPDTWTITPRSGYLARLSAPGYMDCTEWIAGTNKRKLLSELKELYG